MLYTCYSLVRLEKSNDYEKGFRLISPLQTNLVMPQSPVGEIDPATAKRWLVLKTWYLTRVLRLHNKFLSSVLGARLSYQYRTACQTLLPPFDAPNYWIFTVETGHSTHFEVWEMLHNQTPLAQNFLHEAIHRLLTSHIYGFQSHRHYTFDSQSLSVHIVL